MRRLRDHALLLAGRASSEAPLAIEDLLTDALVASAAFQQESTVPAAHPHASAERALRLLESARHERLHFLHTVELHARRVPQTPFCTHAASELTEDHLRHDPLRAYLSAVDRVRATLEVEGGCARAPTASDADDARLAALLVALLRDRVYTARLGEPRSLCIAAADVLDAVLHPEGGSNVHRALRALPSSVYVTLEELHDATLWTRLMPGFVAHSAFCDVPDAADMVKRDDALRDALRQAAHEMEEDGSGQLTDRFFLAFDEPTPRLVRRDLSLPPRESNLVLLEAAVAYVEQFADGSGHWLTPRVRHAFPRLRTYAVALDRRDAPSALRAAGRRRVRELMPHLLGVALARGPCRGWVLWASPHAGLPDALVHRWWTLLPFLLMEALVVHVRECDVATATRIPPASRLVADALAAIVAEESACARGVA